VKHWVFAIWERVLLSLPLVVMGVLALGTYWLVRVTPVVPPVAEVKAVGHEPDYVMHDFAVKSFDAQGQLRSEVTGTVARHYPDTQWLEIEGIRIRSFDTQGRLTTASALRGLTNEDQSEVQLIGNARVLHEAQDTGKPNAAPRMEYRGEFLHAFMHTEQVRSHKPVELIRGNDRFTADRMDFDNVDQVLTLQGRVRGTLTPQSP
jgi:lipopolysaccharide export system protein LptC